MIPVLLLIGLLFSQEAAAEELPRLHPRRVMASSMLRSDWNRYEENYHPNYAADDNPATAWVEGRPGSGEGESLRLELSAVPKAKAVHVSIRNGYQKSEKLLLANAAVKPADIVVYDGTTRVAFASVELTRTMGWQEVVVPVAGKGHFNAVQVEVREVHPGSKYADLCISDVAVRVSTGQPYRAAVENAHKQAIDAWIRERQAQAAALASRPRRYPFVSAQAEWSDEVAAPTLHDEVLAAEKRLDKLLDTAETYRPTPGETYAEPDGAYGLSALMPFLDRAGLKLSADSAKWDVVERSGSDAYGGESFWASHKRGMVHVRWADEAKTVPAALAWRERDEGQERVNWEHDRSIALIFDEKGAPKRAVIREVEAAIEFVEAVRVLDFTTNQSGQISAVTERRLSWASEEKPGRAGLTPTGSARALRMIGEL